VTPLHRPSFRIADADFYSPVEGREGGHVGSDHEQRSLLRNAIQHYGASVPDQALEETDEPGEQGNVRHSRTESIVRVDPQLHSVLGGSFGSSYASCNSRVPMSSHKRRGTRDAARPTVMRLVDDVEDGDENQPLLITTQVQNEDGKTANVIVGQSTMPQTIFNAVNVLIGVGLLSIPLAFKYAGVIIGVSFLTAAACVTAYTSKLLAKCLDIDSSLLTFSDLAFVSFGTKARHLTSMLFTIELLGACVALIILFADSLALLIGHLSITQYKLLCGAFLFPLSFFPLRLLSFTSILGIICCTSIIVTILLAGLLKPTSPGSLHQPYLFPLFPHSWSTLPISFGLLLAPLGGHAVLPAIYRDMRHPYKFRSAVDSSFSITTLLYTCMALIGLLMFGPHVRDEITSNIFEIRSDYPKWLSIVICTCVGIIPVTKLPLTSRPIVATVEEWCGVPSHFPYSENHNASGRRKVMSWSGRHGIVKILVRLGTTVTFVVVAVAIPRFEQIMSLLGAVACFAICIILPVAFHLKLFSGKLTKMEWVWNWFLLVISSILAIVSTVFNFLPVKYM